VFSDANPLYVNVCTFFSPCAITPGGSTSEADRLGKICCKATVFFMLNIQRKRDPLLQIGVKTSVHSKNKRMQLIVIISLVSGFRKIMALST
jgi:hypothetical protein